jgi:hypothetical protein
MVAHVESLPRFSSQRKRDINEKHPMSERRKITGGITGHQNIGDKATIGWVHDQLHDLIVEHKIAYGYSSLAIGADQTFAEILLRMSIPFTAIIPSSDYDSTFTTKADLDRYNHLLASSAEQLRLPFTKSTELAFFEAGKELVRKSEIIFAVWNAKPAKGLGGTGDVVEFSLSCGKRVIHINNVDKSVRVLQSKKTKLFSL